MYRSVWIKNDDNIQRNNHAITTSGYCPPSYVDIQQTMMSAVVSRGRVHVTPFRLLNYVSIVSHRKLLLLPVLHRHVGTPLSVDVACLLVDV